MSVCIRLSRHCTLVVSIITFSSSFFSRSPSSVDLSLHRFLSILGLFPVTFSVFFSFFFDSTRNLLSGMPARVRSIEACAHLTNHVRLFLNEKGASSNALGSKWRHSYEDISSGEISGNATHVCIDPSAQTSDQFDHLLKFSLCQIRHRTLGLMFC